MRRFFIVLLSLLAAGHFALAEEGYGALLAHGMNEELAIGADIFFNETFEGNGRTCSTCHPAADNYVLPANLLGVPVQDPLMVGDPDNFNHVPNLELCAPDDPAEDCQAIRRAGLILINPDGDQPGRLGTGTSYSMRSVPHLLSLSTSIESPPTLPANATGWSGDGAPGNGSLEEFALGAIRQHFTLSVDRVEGLDFRGPSVAEASALEAFQLELGRRAEVALSEHHFRDVNAKLGVPLFNARCVQCHANAGANFGGVGNRNANTHIEEKRIRECPDSARPGHCPQDAALVVAGANFDGGFGTQRLSDDPEDLRYGDGTFNPPPLIEAADTGPFFHDNSAPELEKALQFYGSDDFASSPGCGLADDARGCGLQDVIVPPSPVLVDGEVRLGSMLRTLNAGLNVAMAAQRVNAAAALLDSPSGAEGAIHSVLVLAREEIADAQEVLKRRRFEAGNGVISKLVFDESLGAPIPEARVQLEAIRASLDTMILDGPTSISLSALMSEMVRVVEDHLHEGLYDESDEACGEGSPQPGVYDDCRWAFDLGEANLLFDNRGIAPSMVEPATSLTWKANADGTATLTMSWRTAEWSNPLYDETLLRDTSRQPSMGPQVFKGKAVRLSDGSWQRSFTHTFPCVPNATYRMEVSARVGGVSETDAATAKAGRYCIGY